MKEYSNVELLFASYKTRAYKADQYSSNHKVRTEVEDTHEAEIHFDEITLYKGASLLNYLYYLLGEKNFFDKLTKYLNENLNKNLVSYATFVKYFEVGSNEEGSKDKDSVEIFSKFLDNAGLVKLDCVSYYIFDNIFSNTYVM